MAPSRSVSRGRSTTRRPDKRKRVNTPADTPKKTKNVYVKSKSRSRSSSRMSKNASREEANGVKNAEVYHQNKKSVTFGKSKSVKVSKDFKKKVEKTLEPKKVTGMFTEIGFQRINFPQNYVNRQILNRIGLSTGTDQLLFNPMRILDAASVLFNNKTATEQKYTTTGAGVYDTLTNSFNYANICVNVINSYSKSIIKNNSKRTWMIQIYECSPKIDMDITDVGDANTQWRNGMLQEIDNPLFTLEKKINIADATPESLYMTPNKCKAFMQKWNVEKHDITLEPGQTYDHFVQGPTNVEYDFAKFFKIQGSNTDRRFYDIQKKFTRQIIFTARLDIVTMKVTPIPVGAVYYPAGRAGDTNEIGSSINIETTNYYKVQVPDKAGGTLSVPILGTANFTNTQKRDCYFHRCWQDFAGSSDVITLQQRIEENTGEDNIIVD